MRRTMAFASGLFLVQASPLESNNTCKITRLYPAQPKRVQNTTIGHLAADTNRPSKHFTAIHLTFEPREHIKHE